MSRFSASTFTVSPSAYTCCFSNAEMASFVSASCELARLSSRSLHRYGAHRGLLAPPAQNSGSMHASLDFTNISVRLQAVCTMYGCPEFHNACHVSNHDRGEHCKLEIEGRYKVLASKEALMLPLLRSLKVSRRLVLYR